MPDDLPDLSKMDPEWWLSGASGALYRLPRSAWRDCAIERLEHARSALSRVRQQEAGEWEPPSPGVPAADLMRDAEESRRARGPAVGRTGRHC